MLALQRHREILNILSNEGQVRVTDLARRFDVTEETVRRDLVSLESHSRLVRTHGGAVPAGNDSMHEQPYWEREFFLSDEKLAIARTAVALVEPGETVMIDGSSTALCVARELPDMELTVLTNSLQVALTLADRESIEIVGIGGSLSRYSLSFAGSTAVNALLNYHVNTLFFSCRGISLDTGLSDANEEQAVLRKNMLKTSSKRILLADHAKFNVKALRRIAGFEEIDMLITDGSVDDTIVDELKDRGLEIKVATSYKKNVNMEKV